MSIRRPGDVCTSDGWLTAAEYAARHKTNGHAQAPTVARDPLATTRPRREPLLARILARALARPARQW